MNIKDMLSDKSFLVNFEASSKKNVLDELSKLAEKDIKIDSRILLEALTKREKLGSTAVGNGIAIPHANCPDIDKPKVFVALLSNSLDFNANDDQPVDIIFLLLAPDNSGSEHLQALALVSRLLRNKELTTKLRGCKNTESAFAVISQSVREKAA
jgi:PTS system nitrogen regulatory IIA component|tara:strand:- start:112 stop:576 length:465 start_codon:yes stop_codon:yes gene_type:complete